MTRDPLRPISDGMPGRGSIACMRKQLPRVRSAVRDGWVRTMRGNALLPNAWGQFWWGTMPASSPRLVRAMRTIVGRRIHQTDRHGRFRRYYAQPGATPINCLTLPCGAPRAAEFRTPGALGPPERRKGLTHKEISMGSIPITRSIPGPCPASCGNSSSGKFLIAWEISWPEPVRTRPCHCRESPGMAPAFAPLAAIDAAA